MILFKWLRNTWTAPKHTSAPKATPENARDIIMVAEAWSTLTNVNEWVKHAEAKLGVGLAFLGALLAGFISIAIEAGHPSTLMMVLEAIAGSLILFAIICSTLGLLPKYGHHDEKSKLNPLYYGDVSRYFSNRPEEYAEHLGIILSDPHTLAENLAQQIVANSNVAVRKYTWANRSILLGIAALLATLAVASGLALDW